MRVENYFNLEETKYWREPPFPLNHDSGKNTDLGKDIQLY